MIKPYIVLQVVLITIFTAAIAFAATQKAALSFFIGAVFSVANVLFLIYIGRRLFSKKPFALTIVLILFKYSILGLSLYYLVTSQLLELIWFVVGISILLPSLIGFAVIYTKQLQKKV